MSDLRQEAERALQAWAGPPSSRTADAVRRIVLDVEIGGRVEMVSLALSEAGIRWTSSDAGEHSPFVFAALRFIAGEKDPFSTVSVATSPGLIPSEKRESAPPPSPSAEPAEVRALADLVGVIVRTGVVNAAESPSVEDARARWIEAMPKPMSVDASRWAGRLASVLAAKEIGISTRLLDGASRVLDDLRDPAGSEDTRARVRRWLGNVGRFSEAVTRMTDRTLVEVAREYVTGLERHGIERRYLVCLFTGEVFREDGNRGDPILSVGPCPRKVTVALADIDAGAWPRKLRVLQYSVSNVVSQHDWAKVQRLGASRFQRLAEDYKRFVRENAALSEPFAVLVPHAVERRGSLALLDSEGHAVAVARAEDPGGATTLTELLRTETPAWIAGRLIDVEGTLMIVPLTVGITANGEIRTYRVS